MRRLVTRGVGLGASGNWYRRCGMSLSAVGHYILTSASLAHAGKLTTSLIVSRKTIPIRRLMYLKGDSDGRDN